MNLRILGQGYFTLPHGTAILFVIAALAGVAGPLPRSPNLIFGLVLATILGFLFIYGSMKKIGQVLTWNRTTPFVIAVTYAATPAICISLLDRWVALGVTYLALHVFTFAARRLVNAELARYGIRLRRSRFYGGTEENFRQDVDQFESGAQAPPIPYVTLVDQREID